MYSCSISTTSLLLVTLSRSHVCVHFHTSWHYYFYRWFHSDDDVHPLKSHFWAIRGTFLLNRRIHAVVVLCDFFEKDALFCVLKERKEKLVFLCVRVRVLSKSASWVREGSVCCNEIFIKNVKIDHVLGMKKKVYFGNLHFLRSFNVSFWNLNPYA